MKQAVLFDMDGTLLDTEPVYARSLYEAMQANGIPADIQEFYALAGLELGEKIKIIACAHGILPDAEKIRTDYRAVLPQNLNNFAGLIKPGAEQMLQTLRDRGCLLALCSNSTSNRIEAVFQDTGLGRFFDVIINGDHVRRRKPDPEIYQSAMRTLSLPAAACAAVEDSVFGIRAAKAAGLQTVAVLDPRFPYIGGSADCAVDSLFQVAEKLEALL